MHYDMPHLLIQLGTGLPQVPVSESQRLNWLFSLSISNPGSHENCTTSDVRSWDDPFTGGSLSRQSIPIRTISTYYIFTILHN